MTPSKQSAEERVEHTPTPWELTYFSTPNGNPIETVQDVADTVAHSALCGDKAELHGVTIPDCDNGDPVPVICYTGNGPKSAANAAFIVTAVNSHEALVSALRAAMDKLEKVVKWLESNAKILEDSAKSHDRFKSVADDELANAKNYRATAESIRKEITAARAALQAATGAVPLEV